MSRTWDLLTYVRYNKRTWRGLELETEATGMIKGATNVRKSQCHVRETITRTCVSSICTWNMNWRKAGKRSLEIFEESKTHVRGTQIFTYVSYTRQEEDFIPEYVGSNFTQIEKSSWSNGQKAWSHVRELDLKYVRKEIQVREMLRMRNRSYWMVQTSTSRTWVISEIRELGICYDQRTWNIRSRTCAGFQSKTRT